MHDARIGDARDPPFLFQTCATSRPGHEADEAGRNARALDTQATSLTFDQVARPSFLQLSHPDLVRNSTIGPLRSAKKRSNSWNSPSLFRSSLHSPL